MRSTTVLPADHPQGECAVGEHNRRDRAADHDAAPRSFRRPVGPRRAQDKRALTLDNLTAAMQVPSANKRIGPYHIVLQLGAGRMGEVYCARDTRLDREVAIKLLPASFANDEERLRRFEQEARATSSLNHPNILTIYDIGNDEGSPYIVSELLEGEELREQLNDGACDAQDD